MRRGSVTLSLLSAYVDLADSWKADIWGTGHLGHNFDPVKGNDFKYSLPNPDLVTAIRRRIAEGWVPAG